MNRNVVPVTRLPVKPDPERAAELQRRFDSVQYRPEQGFHRDRIQPKQQRR